MCELQISFQDSWHKPVTHLICMLFCLLPEIQQEIRKVKVSTVGSFADYGDCSFPDFLILVSLAVIFSQVWIFFYSRCSESQWKIRIWVSFLTFLWTYEKEKRYLKGISFILLISRQASSFCFIHNACTVNATVLVGGLPGTSSDGSMRNVASLFFTTDLAVLKEAEYRTWISDLKCQVVVKSSMFLLMGMKRISLHCYSKHVCRACSYFLDKD